ncbi:HpcH/HpaI aldolase family protein [Natronocella acetinitrilica]|nr:aldolase/citrate lyase family protein [Natronocella acetinitrilica]
MPLLNGEPHVGVFIKTASHQVVEVLGAAGLAFGVIDGEHAPIDRSVLDTMLLAGYACRLPLLVRVADGSGPAISSVLDMGAAGIVVPHVDCPEYARQVVAHAKFAGGRRGLSTSPRYAGYGSMSMHEAVCSGDETAVICQIEDPEGVQNAQLIAQVEGVDALFIGPLDLAHSLGADSVREPVVREACEHIARAACGAGKAAAIFLSDPSDKAYYQELGVTLFIIGSDQSMMRQGTRALSSA